MRGPLMTRAHNCTGVPHAWRPPLRYMIGAAQTFMKRPLLFFLATSVCLAGDAEVRAYQQSMLHHQRRAMSVDPVDGEFFHKITLDLKAKRVLEIGTSTGYSGSWFALALQKTGGKLVTLELDPGRHAEAQKNFAAMGSPLSSTPASATRSRYCPHWTGHLTSSLSMPGNPTICATTNWCCRRSGRAALSLRTTSKTWLGRWAISFRASGRTPLFARSSCGEHPRPVHQLEEVTVSGGRRVPCRQKRSRIPAPARSFRCADRWQICTPPR